MICSNPRRMELLGWYDANQYTANADGATLTGSALFDCGPMGRGIQKPSISTLHPLTIFSVGTVKFYKTTSSKLSDSGLPGIEFDTTASHVESGGVAVFNAKMSRVLATPFCIICCCRPVSSLSGSPPQQLISLLAGGPTAVSMYTVDFVGNTGKSDSSWAGGGSAGPTVTSEHTPATKQFIYARNFQVATNPVYINGKFLHNVVTTSLASAGQTLGIDVMPYSSVSNSGAVAIFHEYMVIDRALEDSEREQIEGYLAHKWWAPANIPLAAEHPYFDAPPGNGSFDFFYVQQTNQ